MCIRKNTARGRSMGIKFYGRSAFMYKLFGNVPHYMHAAFKNGYPQPCTKAEKENTRAHTHHRREAKCYCKFYTFALSAFYWLHRKINFSPLSIYIYERETFTQRCKFHCNPIANTVSFLAYPLLDVFRHLFFAQTYMGRYTWLVNK